MGGEKREIDLPVVTGGGSKGDSKERERRRPIDIRRRMWPVRGKGSPRSNGNWPMISR